MHSAASALPTSNEVVNVFRTGAQKIEEIHVLALTRLGNAQQNKDVAKASLRRMPLYHAATQCKCLHGVLCVIVVPWDIIEIQKSKHLIAILYQAIDQLPCSFTGTVRNEIFIEAVNR